MRTLIALALSVLLGVFVLMSGRESGAQAPAGARFQIAYATFLGGPEWEEAREAIPYPDGSVLVGAQAVSAHLPVSPDAFQKDYAGDNPRLGHPGIYGGDCYIARLSADGRRILFATYLGGSRQERNTYGLELDQDGNIIVATLTRSLDMPVTPRACQPRYGGGNSDIYIAKLSADCTRLLWGTYLGGSRDDTPRGGFAQDAQNNVLVVGTTNSADFPTTPGVVQAQLRGPCDALLAKLRADGSGLVFSTLLGGSGEDDAIMGARIDAAGYIYVAGHTRSADFPVTPGCAQSRPGGQSDCYLAKLAPQADKILYATYLGGSGNDFAEHRPWLNPDGSFLLAGFCGSLDFPVTANALGQGWQGQNTGFLAQLAPDGAHFAFVALLGGEGGNLLMPTPDAAGNIWVVGSTAARDLPVTPDALQRSYGGGEQDGVLAAFSPDGSRLVYCSYLGGSGRDLIRSLAWGSEGALYLVGFTASPDFPVTPGAWQTKFGGGAGDAFIVKLMPQR